MESMLFKTIVFIIKPCFSFVPFVTISEIEENHGISKFWFFFCPLRETYISKLS